MKWTSVLSALSLAIVAAATPVPQLGQKLNIYRLKLESKFKPVDGRYLSVNTTSRGPGGTNRVGFFAAGKPVEVYTIASQLSRGLVELHTWPIGIVDHVIGIAGGTSLSTLVDITNPHNANYTPSKPALVSWDAFSFDGEEQSGTVEMGTGTGNWIVRPVAQGYGVEMWDGRGVITADYQHVNLKYELVKTTTEW